jgi:hypothetical protein
MAARQIITSHQPIMCEICGRSLLRGEFAATFSSGAATHSVCELCTSRAFGEGWVREGAAITAATQARTTRARSLVSRLRARLDDGAAPEQRWPGAGSADGTPERHVHAVPAEAGAQIARAIELFNASEHPKTIAGVIRSLGAPHAHLAPTGEELVVGILIAWELCWYRFEADLDGEVVRKRGQGYQLTELEGELEAANAAANPDGRLALAL